MNLVIVESPAKAKTINKYLGDNYTVLASYGHIRDLPSKNGSVDPNQNFKMEWEVDGHLFSSEEFHMQQGGKIEDFENWIRDKEPIDSIEDVTSYKVH